MNPLRVGVALGGGAARGLFHVGVVRALREAGVQVDAWAGTSAGSVVASVCAAGLTPREIDELAVRVRWTENIVAVKRSALDWFGAARRLLTGRGPVNPGLVETSKIGDYVNSAIGHRRFSELGPLIVTAMDIETGEKVLFCSGAVAEKLAAVQPLPPTDEEAWRSRYVPREVVIAREDVGEAVRCSSCIPVVMSSVTVDCDGRKRLLNDGGVGDMIPVKPLRALGCRKVIAVHLGFVTQTDRVGNLKDVGLNSLQFLARDQIRASLEEADAVIYDPAIENRSFVWLDRDLMEQGYRHTLSQMPRILKALEDEQSPAPARELAPAELAG